MPSSLKIRSGLVEGQVLQRLGSRGAAVAITGDCEKSATVFATIFAVPKKKPLPGWNLHPVGRAARGKFNVRLAGIPPGGPYSVQLTCDGKKAVINEFFVGDVWVLAGQSNMQGVGNRDGAARPHPLIRSFSMRREWSQAREPLHVGGESPDFCHNGGNQLTHEEAGKLRRTALKGTGPGLFFARDMLKRNRVPQGLICVSRGGTSMAQWDPALKKQGGKSLYASMIASIRSTGQPVAGVLWYQGEGDAFPDSAPRYTRGMKALVAASRLDLRLPRLPWIIVQIARLHELRGAAEVQAWNSIQEQQRLLPPAISRLEMVAAVDLAVDDCIHISAQAFPKLAARLARAAARLVHGDRREQRPPRFRGFTISRDLYNSNGWWIEVSFDDVVGGLRASGRANGFAVVDREGRNLEVIFKTTLLKSTARLHVNLPSLENMRLHYGLGMFPYCNITDGRGESLPVFGPLGLGKPLRGPLA